MIKGEFASTNNRNHFFRYLHFAITLLAAYRQEEPFHIYLKKYFSSNKKHGSTDRKGITSLCYNYFRLGKAVSIDDSLEEKILLANFLIENKTSPLLEQLRPEWNENIHCPIIEKAGLVKGKFDIEKIFPFQNELSEEIDFQDYNLSFLQQPKLFIRIRPGFHQLVEQKLNAANISFEKIGDNCLAFVNNEKVTKLLEIDKEAVIQDFNSQRVGDFLTSDILHPRSAISVWDCCAASGGKSILAFDILKNIELTVSDTRKSILENLKSRFAKAGIKKYRAIVADLSINFDKNIFDKKTLFDFIIADVPCTGSGTWSRTPEQLSFFSKKSIQKYAALQQTIVKSAVQYLGDGGYFLYITCSVFKKENEDNVAFIQKELGLKLLERKYMKGYEMRADTLFMAMFRKTSIVGLEKSGLKKWVN